MKDTEDQWYELLSDEKKAEILKAKIEQKEQTKRALISTEGHWWVRGLSALFLAVVIIVALALGWHYIDAKYPSATPTTKPTTSASATATATATKE